jgi:hypothetical protein
MFRSMELTLLSVILFDMTLSSMRILEKSRKAASFHVGPPLASISLVDKRLLTLTIGRAVRQRQRSRGHSRRVFL